MGDYRILSLHFVNQTSALLADLSYRTHFAFHLLLWTIRLAIVEWSCIDHVTHTFPN